MLKQTPHLTNEPIGRQTSASMFKSIARALKLEDAAAAARSWTRCVN